MLLDEIILSTMGRRIHGWVYLHTPLKFGITENHWNELIFLAYDDHQADAILLSGIPDLKATLPHA